MVQYTFVEKTDADNEKMLVGGSVINGMGTTGGMTGGGTVTSYAVPAGLVLATSLFAENTMYGGGSVAVIPDSLFDSLFGLAAFSAPRRKKTVKRRVAL